MLSPEEWLESIDNRELGFSFQRKKRREKEKGSSLLLTQVDVRFFSTDSMDLLRSGCFFIRCLNHCTAELTLLYLSILNLLPMCTKVCPCMCSNEINCHIRSDICISPSSTAEFFFTNSEASTDRFDDDCFAQFQAF